MSEQVIKDWTQGGDQLVFQRCLSCQHIWYFRRGFCPACGSEKCETLASKGRGVVHAVTVVHRAPSEEFRALVPYALVLVDMDEGFRVMGHAEADVKIGSFVSFVIRRLAFSQLPLFFPIMHRAIEESPKTVYRNF